MLPLQGNLLGTYTRKTSVRTAVRSFSSSHFSPYHMEVSAELYSINDRSIRIDLLHNICDSQNIKLYFEKLKLTCISRKETQRTN
jgi:hypothetical protein